MPVRKCTKNGKPGHQYGDQKCYTGPNSKRKATKQGHAIKASQGRRKGK